jgi:hypothetical protein
MKIPKCIAFRRYVFWGDGVGGRDIQRHRGLGGESSKVSFVRVYGFTEMCSGSEECSYSRPIGFCITQL